MSTKRIIIKKQQRLKSMKNKYDITEADIREKLDQICVEYEKNHPVDRAKSSRKYIILISVALMVIGAALVVRMFIK